MQVSLFAYGSIKSSLLSSPDGHINGSVSLTFIRTVAESKFHCPLSVPQRPHPAPPQSLLARVLRKIKTAAVISLLNVFSTPGSSCIFPFGMNQLLWTPSVAASSVRGEPFSLQSSLGEIQKNECISGEALRSYFQN